MIQVVVEISSKVITKENIDFFIKCLRFILTALFIPIINWYWHYINYVKFKNMIKKSMLIV
ncbi:hypothetical protein CYD95_05090 [Pediococcus acidilactici]|uniref:Uncharacterized protein n=1 Tax=Pediococcus acidilactici DSM 20284 TaxID=862514 RepID=E0NDR4_PEDAC|nr:hypothetical protein CYD95_05090 [Pediococcus acidilactici]EFL96385.1 hypothetical protein HMPREF0623_0436 [Pediococcus acidilactici DSM 20284]GHC31196.1 hypothetical protein GCM10008920_02160 [Pediococcus acidilactici]